MIRLIRVTPTPAPRQTKKDRWDPSGPVLRYRAFRDEIALHIKDLPADFFHVVFLIPMPRSWSEKRKRETNNTPHYSKPDKDNLEKALIDAVYRKRDDSHIWNSASTKLWHREGGIILSDRILESLMEFPQGVIDQAKAIS